MCSYVDQLVVFPSLVTGLEVYRSVTQYCDIYVECCMLLFAAGSSPQAVASTCITTSLTLANYF